LKVKEFLVEYKKQVSNYLRSKEAHISRGNLDRLVALEKMNDDQLLIKWSFLSAIAGSIFAFILLPILIGIMRYFLPHILITLLWSIAKVMMFLVIAMYGLAFYLLFKKHKS
jgi:hypothetical protein